MTPAEMAEYLDEVFPQVKGKFAIDEIGEGTVQMRLLADDSNIRPGGTVQGPSMFGLADVTAYVATLNAAGKVPLAVTTSGTIDFMRKPDATRDVIARATVLKAGRVLTVTDILMYSEGSDKPVARATMTYSIPPAKG